MSDNIFSRTELLLGAEAVKKLSCSNILLFGVGGVGGYAAEALVRSGVGAITLVDPDRISESNINRQIIALHSTVGRLKTEVMAERAKDINPAVKVIEYPIFYSKDTAGEIDFSEYDFIIDAIDTVSSKLMIIEKATALGIPVISSMGAGGKLDPSRFCVTDIYKTSVCPLARVMRTELKKRGIKKLPVVFSDEEQIKSGVFDPDSGKPIPASCAFVPSAAGLVLAGYVIRTIAGK